MDITIPFALYLCCMNSLTKTLFLSFFILMTLNSFSQEETDVEVVDSLYREDQFYLGTTFNLLTAGPSDLSQNGLSVGVQFGFVRDMPINKRRNKAIGIGVGLAVDIFNQNLFIGEEIDGESTIYSIIDDDLDVGRNRFSFYSIEAPLEYRWRSSKLDSSHKFWRIYGGVRLGYIYFFRSIFEQSGNSVRQTDIPELNRFQYGLTLSFGYDAFDFQAYYGLNTLFSDNAQVNNENVDVQILRLGIQFYFL